MVRWADGEGQAQAGHGTGSMEKGQTDRFLGFGQSSGALTPPDAESLGEGLGTARRYVLSGLNRLFPRSIDKSLNQRSWCSPGHSPKHPTCWVRRGLARLPGVFRWIDGRSEEHTSELQSLR